MAVNDLDLLRRELPHLFADRSLPSNWDDEWLVVPVLDPEAFHRDTLRLDAFSVDTVGISPQNRRPTLRWKGERLKLPEFGRFPGSLALESESEVPPPDAMAFYLPFHYFHPTWWGVYIVLERLEAFAAWLSHVSDGELTLTDCLDVGRLFLYSHEAFHHAVEAYATRLEITHRTPLYVNGFQQLFDRVRDTDECIEEALATAHGYRRVRSLAFRKPDDPRKRDAALRSLEVYIESCPPGYRRAMQFGSTRDFDQQRVEFAEANHNESLGIAPSQPLVWFSFPHAFSGISRITSRVNYLISRDSPLVERMNLCERYLRYRDLAERLVRLARCQVVRQGNGSHEIWQSPAGHRFPVPRHPGDLGRGLLAKIIKQAGLDLSVSEFLRA